MRIALALLLLGVVGLVGTSALWLRASATPPLPPDRAGTDRLLSDLAEREAAHVVTIDLARRYAGRGELLDPRAALPSWHRFGRDGAVAVHRATRSCPPAPVDEVEPALAKVLRFHAATCGELRDVGELVEQAPFLHPSGASYAALTLARVRLAGDARRAFAKAHARSFHVTELAGIERELPGVLDAEGRALAGFPLSTWEALGRGDAIALAPEAIVFAEPSATSLGLLRAYSRSSFESLASQRGLALVPRGAAALCARPASPALCWEARAGQAGRQRLLALATGGAATLVVIGIVLLGALRVRERQEAHADRIHVLRTLTHELRTPAMSLALDIEPLRAAYDALPANCQEPVLRLSDGIERLARVLHRSARYMALFETPNAEKRTLPSVAPIPSLRDLFEEYSAEWPEGIALVAPEHDASFVTDGEWLGVAVRNLAENAVRHGAPPVTVAWAVRGGALVVRVADGGSTPALRLAAAAEPYARGKESAGLGLGLAIALRIAGLLGGTLTHHPTPTTFELRLPAGGPPA